MLVLTEPSVVVDKVISSKGAQGFEAATGECEDMVNAVIIDPNDE